MDKLHSSQQISQCTNSWEQYDLITWLLYTTLFTFNTNSNRYGHDNISDSELVYDLSQLFTY